MLELEIHIDDFAQHALEFREIIGLLDVHIRAVNKSIFHVFFGGRRRINGDGKIVERAVFSNVHQTLQARLIRHVQIQEQQVWLSVALEIIQQPPAVFQHGQVCGNLEVRQRVLKRVAVVEIVVDQQDFYGSIGIHGLRLALKVAIFLIRGLYGHI